MEGELQGRKGVRTGSEAHPPLASEVGGFLVSTWPLFSYFLVLWISMSARPALSPPGVGT